MGGRRANGLVGVLTAAAIAAVPAGATAQTSEPPAPAENAAARGLFGPEPAQMKLKLTNGKDGTVRMGERFGVIGTLRPFVPNQTVGVKLLSRGDVVKRKKIEVRRYRHFDMGRFKLRSGRLIEPGKYRFKVFKHPTSAQESAFKQTNRVRITYPDLDPGDRGPAVRVLNDLLDKQGYMAPNSSGYGSATGRAVLAARKVNRMSRVQNINPSLLRKLAAREAEFKPAHPGAGHHAEVDISRQVLALVNNGKAQYTFHISSGAPGTPSDRGSFTFYRKDPGFNSVGMYYSVYYNRGEATHGYRSVPNYPASHGCIRNPIPNSVFIYNWIDLGDPMFVYG
jgi:hypothetical protein